jgi:hypothetical protein
VVERPDRDRDRDRDRDIEIIIDGSQRTDGRVERNIVLDDDALTPVRCNTPL